MNKTENNKLQERINKLRSALEILRKNSDSIWEGRISGEALAQDDEMETFQLPSESKLVDNLIAKAHTNISELTRRLKIACIALRQFEIRSQHSDELLADELETPLG